MQNYLYLKKVCSKLTCKQTARLLFAQLLCSNRYTNSNYALNVLQKPCPMNYNGYLD